MMSMPTTPRLTGYVEESQAFLMSAPSPQKNFQIEQDNAQNSINFEKDKIRSSNSKAIVKSEPQNIIHKFDRRIRSDSGLIPDWTTSPPFSCTSGFLSHFGQAGGESFSLHRDDDYDDDKTPMNSFKTECVLEQFVTISNASSCRDSGTESVDAFDSADDLSALQSSNKSNYTSSSCSEYQKDNLKVLHFFSSDKSKTSPLAGRRGTKFVSEESMICSDNSADNGNDDTHSEGESTLSESSLSPNGDDDVQRITPELVVAAIDKKIKEQKQLLKNKKKKKILRKSNDNAKDEIAGDEDSDSDIAKQQQHSSTNIDKDNSSPSQADSDSSPEDKSLIPIVEIDESSTDEEFGESGRIPLIRSTSLKTGKTPPGTPRTKKFVRFADAMGLDLESIRTIADDVPYMPPVAAFKGLALEDDDIKWIYGQRSSTMTSNSSNNNTLIVKTQSSITGMSSGHLSPTNSKPALRMLFCQPISDPGPFMERVRNFKVCLENCIVTGPHGPTDMFDLTCIIRVLNMGFEKHVNLRYTTNEWLTWTDISASYVPHSCDGFSDKFTCMFHIAVNSNGHQSMMPGQRLLFAVQYLANGNEEFWDNNMGLNYALIYQRT